MPWKIKQDGDGYWVVKKASGTKVHRTAHPTEEEAKAHLSALYANADVREKNYG